MAKSTTRIPTSRDTWDLNCSLILLTGRGVAILHWIIADISTADKLLVNTRFAPSPTGHLHLGHAYAAWVAQHFARSQGGNFYLRQEDIDGPRCRLEYETAIEEDLHWLGISWDQPVWRQSERLPIYQAALSRLQQMELLYPCFCTRQEIAASASAPQGPEGPLYPGTCRQLSAVHRSELLTSGKPFAWRLDTAAAIRRTGTLTWNDLRHGSFTAQPALLGDVVLARKDIATSYHLAVTVDDAAQEISLVTRGEDLLLSTHMHRLLQALLELSVPQWYHHQLICDETGRRLAKRDHARSLRSLREAGWTPDRVRAEFPMLGPATLWEGDLRPAP
jgi:glutamyl-Q tRNA(Asp) synthetase